MEEPQSQIDDVSAKKNIIKKEEKEPESYSAVSRVFGLQAANLDVATSTVEVRVRNEP